MSSTFLVPVLAALSLFTAACGVTVAGGGAGGSGGGGGGTSTGSGAGGGPSVLVYGDTKLTLRATSFAATCAEPDKTPPYADCNWFTLEIGFPDSLLVPGPLADSADITTFVSESGSPNSGQPGDCPGTAAVSGGGPGGGLIGEVVFGAIDSTSVVVTLGGFDATFLEASIDGTYTAARCQ